jgi:hypothetical protein
VAHESRTLPHRLEAEHAGITTPYKRPRTAGGSPNMKANAQGDQRSGWGRRLGQSGSQDLRFQDRVREPLSEVAPACNTCNN